MVENNVKCSYILQYPKREESLVFFSVRCNGMTTKVSTKQVVKTEMWDKKTHLCYTSREKFKDRENRAATKTNTFLKKFNEFMWEKISYWNDYNKCLTDKDELTRSIKRYANWFFDGELKAMDKQETKATEWMLSNITAIDLIPTQDVM